MTHYRIFCDVKGYIRFGVDADHAKQAVERFNAGDAEMERDETEDEHMTCLEVEISPGKYELVPPHTYQAA